MPNTNLDSITKRKLNRKKVTYVGTTNRIGTAFFSEFTTDV